MSSKNEAIGDICLIGCFVADAYEAIRQKGGTMPACRNTHNLASSILFISSAPESDTYSKAQANVMLNNKIAATDVYSKTEVDDKIQQEVPVAWSGKPLCLHFPTFTWTEVDQRHNTLKFAVTPVIPIRNMRTAPYTTADAAAIFNAYAEMYPYVEDSSTTEIRGEILCGGNMAEGGEDPEYTYALRFDYYSYQTWAPDPTVSVARRDGAGAVFSSELGGVNNPISTLTITDHVVTTMII